MIARYVLGEYSNGYNLFGFAHTNKNIFEHKITKFYFDIRNIQELEINIHIIKPDIIIHLAGVSSSIEAFKEPLYTLELNGMTVAHICDIVHKNKWNTKLFNASSSEMYKGHLNYDVKEDDHNMYHCHPYSIAKIMGQSIVDFYRETYKLPFSNGTFFTIESKYKNGNFLLRKITEHCKKWKEINEPLKLGSLDSYRTILHASDAAKAIKIILEQTQGDNYIISGNENIKILDLVLKVYSLNNINININDNIIYSNNKIVAIIDNINKGIDIVQTNITGTSKKLHKLGWIPKYSIDNIVNEIINS